MTTCEMRALLEAFVPQAGPWAFLAPLFTAIGFVVMMLFQRGAFNKLSSPTKKRLDEMEKGFVPDLGAFLARIEDKVNALSVQCSEMETRLNHVDKSALMGVIYNPAIHVVDRIRAFDCYLRIGGNGLVTEYAINNLLLPNRKDWIRVTQESQIKILHEEQYRERVEWINRHLA